MPIVDSSSQSWLNEDMSNAAAFQTITGQTIVVEAGTARIGEAFLHIAADPIREAGAGGHWFIEAGRGHSARMSEATARAICAATGARMEWATPTGRPA